jgi:general secretion pathway protein L
MAASQSIADRLSAPLERARTRYARSPVHQFMRWWWGELAGLLPASWRALFAEGQARVLYVIEQGTLQLRLEEAGRETLLASIPLDTDRDLSAQIDAALGVHRVERPRWLLLPGAQLLRRRITLPAAAIERLRDVVAHELDRQTPFRADQVVYDSRVLGVHDASQMAQVELLVLPKDRLEAALAPLGALADQLSGVDVRDADSRDQPGRPLHCNLLPLERRQPPDRRALWLHLGLAAIAVIALLFALERTLDNRRAALAQLESAVAARHQQARLVGALDKQLEEAADGANFLARTRAAKPPMLAVLADISARVPDNTYLERFSEQEGQIYLTGQSGDAPSLVAQLQSSTVLRAPALSGSVQPDAATKRDRFTLVAELAAAPTTSPMPAGAAHAPAQR